MKVLGILAGPRKGRAVDLMLDAVLKGAKENGAEIEKLSLYDYDIRPCTGCCACYGTKVCNIKDDHQKILDKMAEADAIVFASPTYWSNVTSVAKALFDRSVRFFDMTAMGPKRKAKNPSRVILITACGAPYPFSHLMGMIGGAMHAMKAFFGCTSARITPLYATGMLDPHKSNPSGRQLERAYRAGKSI